MQKYEEDFYVYLFSNGSKKLHPHNTASKFRNELQVPINFGSDTNNWEVGIPELQIPKAYFNVTKGNEMFFINYKPKPSSTVAEGSRAKRSTTKSIWGPTIAIPMWDVHFTNLEDFFRALQKSFTDAKNNTLKIDYEREIRQVRIRDSTFTRIVFPWKFQDFLEKIGFPRNMIGKTITLSEPKFDIKLTLDYQGPITIPASIGLPFYIMRRERKPGALSETTRLDPKESYQFRETHNPPHILTFEAGHWNDVEEFFSFIDEEIYRRKQELGEEFLGDLSFKLHKDRRELEIRDKMLSRITFSEEILPVMGIIGLPAEYRDTTNGFVMYEKSLHIPLETEHPSNYDYAFHIWHPFSIKRETFKGYEFDHKLSPEEAAKIEAERLQHVVNKLGESSTPIPKVTVVPAPPEITEKVIAPGERYVGPPKPSTSTNLISARGENNESIIPVENKMETDENEKEEEEEHVIEENKEDRVTPLPPTSISNSITKRMYLTHGYYKSPIDIIKAIHSMMNRYAEESDKSIELKVLPDGRIDLKVNDGDHFIKFGKGLSEMLGLQKQYHNVWIGQATNQYHISDDTIDMSGGLNFMLIYSDIVDTSRVGDRSGRLLRCVSSNRLTGTSSSGSSNEHEMIVLNFPFVYYVPVSRSYIDSIDIAIHTDFGEEVRFIERKSMIVLHFRRKKHSGLL
jgi:hypothetical protein